SSMYDLTNFSKSVVRDCGNRLRKIAEPCFSMEEVANKMVRHLYDELEDPKTGQKSCALVRFYKTIPYETLGAALQAFGCGVGGDERTSPTMECLTLLGTAGANAGWNSRQNSVGYKVIPLASEGFVSKIPMISRLIYQFGVDLRAVLRRNRDGVTDLSRR